jgi:transcriptional regulator, MerR family
MADRQLAELTRQRDDLAVTIADLKALRDEVERLAAPVAGA